MRANSKSPAQSKARKPRTAPDPSADLENEIEVAEAALRAVEDELADPGAWATPKKTAASARRHEQAKRRVEELYERL